MAMKIKKKDPSKSSPEVDASEDIEDEELDEKKFRDSLAENNVDPFERTTLKTANWVENNRIVVFGSIAVVIAAIVGGYLYMEQQKEIKIAESTLLTPAFEGYAKPVDGSAELEQIKSNPNLPQPEETYKTPEERWMAVAAAADATLSKNPNSDVARSAQLAKAGASLGLKKYDDAIAAYQAYLANSPDPATKPPVLQGLATAYLGSGKLDDAVKTLKELEELDEAYKTTAKYQQAIIHEQNGKVEDAKSLYHQILESDPTFNKKTDIERRLATL